MKILKKHVELGEKTFDVAIDRAIVADIFEAYPEQLEVLLSVSKIEDSENSIVSLAKSKYLKKIILLKETTKDVVGWSLHMLLEKAGMESPKEKASDILNYVEENEVDEFYDAIWGFILEGFTLGERERKAKVSFVMK